MSNNKQSMKLYTEEQVRKMFVICIDSDLYEHILTFEDILKTETPIELPSDEEIEAAGQKQILYNTSVRDWWILGATWLKDKIQGDKK